MKEPKSNSIGEPNIEALAQEGLPVRLFFTSAQYSARKLVDFA